MKFASRFNCSRSSLWTALVVAASLSVPVYAATDEPEADGKITAVDVIGRAVEIGGIRYILDPQAEIRLISGEVPRALKITDLKVGHFTFMSLPKVSGATIKKLEVLDPGQSE